MFLSLETALNLSYYVVRNIVFIGLLTDDIAVNESLLQNNAKTKEISGVY